MLDQKLATAMQRIIANADERFNLNNTTQRLVDAGLGKKRGKSAYFSSNDKEEMRKWLLAKGFSVEHIDMSGMSRGELLSITPLEKAGGESVKRDRVSIKALAGQPLRIGGEMLNLPYKGHLDVDWTEIAGDINHQSILVVENYENFNRLHETSFTLSGIYQSPLVIYRGDPNESRLDNVLGFIRHINLPVMAFMDADPAGIANASKMQNLVGMVLPSEDTLASQLSDPRTARNDLFMEQYAVYGQMLDKLSEDHPCYSVWQLVSKFAAGVVQERWITDGHCNIFGVN